MSHIEENYHAMLNAQGAIAEVMALKAGSLALRLSEMSTIDLRLILLATGQLAEAINEELGSR